MRAGAALEAGGVPVDLARVQHGVAALADVDERRLHAGQHVLHPAEVDVARVRRGARLGHVVLDQDVVLEHRDLGAVAALADHHHAVDGLAAGQELRLGEDRRRGAGRCPGPPGGAAAWPPAGWSRARPDLVVGAGLGLAAAVADVHHGVRRVVVGRLVGVGTAATAAAPAPAPAGGRALAALLARSPRRPPPRPRRCSVPRSVRPRRRRPRPRRWYGSGPDPAGPADAGGGRRCRRCPRRCPRLLGLPRLGRLRLRDRLLLRGGTGTAPAPGLGVGRGLLGGLGCLIGLGRL